MGIIRCLRCVSTACAALCPSLYFNRPSPAGIPRLWPHLMWLSLFYDARARGIKAKQPSQFKGQAHF